MLFAAILCALFPANTSKSVAPSPPATQLPAPRRADEAPPLAGIRWQVLQTLYLVASGEPLIVLRTDDDLHPVAIGGWQHHMLPARHLITRGWVEFQRASDWIPGLELFGISPTGREALETGRRWWQSLTALQKLQLKLTE